MTPLPAPLTDLAHSFPSLRTAPGVRPWDAKRLVAWASGGVSHGERLTAQLGLAVWSSEGAWPCGRFDLMEALSVWDRAHREAFLAWARDPWWP